LVAVGQKQRGDVGLVQDVLKLVRPIRRVDVDEDRANLRDGELGNDPLRPVGRPDADVLAGLDTKGKQAASDLFHVQLEFAVASPVSKPGKNKAAGLALPLGGSSKTLGDVR